jgi:nucleotide-binding universal stress UspA family protein
VISFAEETDMSTAMEPRTILVPLDGSTFAEQALPLAVSLAGSTRSRIVLVLVQDIPLWPDELARSETVMAMRRILHAEDEAYLRTIQQRYQRPEQVIDIVTLPGELRQVGETLSLFTQEAGVSLVVLATHGRGGVKRAWLGSVADYLVRHVHVPVVLTRPGCAPAPEAGRILVPLDGSPLAETALEEACTIAAGSQQEVTLVQVVPPVMRTISALEVAYAGFDEELTSMHRAAAEDYLDDVEERVRARGLRCTGLTVLGPNVAEAILELARPGPVALIAIATHGRGGVRRLVLGSIADKIVRAAEVPVLVYRPSMTPRTEARPARPNPRAGPRSCTL